MSFQNQSGGLWTSSELSMAIEGLGYVQNAISDAGVLNDILGLSSGGLKLIMCPSCDSTDQNHHYTPSANSITFDNSIAITTLEFLHEIGHAVDWNVGSGVFSNNWWSHEVLVGKGWLEDTRTCFVYFTCKTGNLIQDSSYTPPNPHSFSSSILEDFADTFAGYVLNHAGQYPSGWNPMPSDRTNALDVQFQP